MARYIDADELKAKIQKNISDYYWSDGGGYYLAEDAIEEIDFTETVDVAPKSEVAREIFEEIDKILKEHTTEQHYRGERFIPKTIDIGIERAIRELKKKYTKQSGE